jgi:FkbM family methyltransferase
MSSGNRTLKQAIRRAGLEKPAKAVYRLLSPEYRRFVATHGRDLRDNHHLRLLMAYTLQEDANCIDIGCNRGEILEDIVRVAPKGDHHAFEPIPELANDLRRRFPSVHVHDQALSNRTEVREFVHVADADEYSGLHARDLAAKHDLRRFEVEVARLDDVLPDDYDAALIKIDVEGAELQVLEGAVETLERCHPKVWFEHGALSAAWFDATSYDVWDLLCGELRYRIFDAEGDGPLDRQTFASGTGIPMWTYLATT